MRQKYRTTCFSDEIIHYDRSLEDTSGWREDVVGFRIVHDNAGRRIHGTSWASPLPTAAAARELASASYNLRNLGLRLACDGEDRE